MKSFKKIALAMVAAMTLGTLSVAPANAAVMTVAATVNGSAPATAGTSSATAVALPVPEDNTVGATEALKLVATVDTGTVVVATATNATIVADLHTTAAPVTASSGSASLSVATGTGTTATFYVYTKTTAVGTVVLTNQGTTLTYYVQGTAGKVNTVALTGLDAGSQSSVITVTATTTDVFGNKISGRALSAIIINGTVDTATTTTGAGLSDFGAREFKVTLPTTGTSTLVVSAASGELAATVAGFNSVTSSAVKTIAVRDLAGELAAEKAARAADKVAADAALAAEKAAAATAKAAADAAAVKAAADLVTANAEIAKLKADAVVAKAAADKALADAIAKATADAAAAKAASDKSIADLKAAFNKLARSWNKKNPTAKVALVK